jgi:hypothetical protein
MHTFWKGKTTRRERSSGSPMHFAKLSFCSMPLTFISSKRFSTDFQPSLPADVLSRKRRPRSPDCAPECVRLRPIMSGTRTDDTLDTRRRIPDAIRDGCFFIRGGGGSASSLDPPSGTSAYPDDEAISGVAEGQTIRTRSPQGDSERHLFQVRARLVWCKFGREGEKGREVWRSERGCARQR